MIEPNITMATPKDAIRLSAIVRSLNRRKGRIGSTARSWMRTKAMPETMAMPKRTSEVVEPQAQEVPPEETATSSATSAVDRVAMPL